MMKTSTSPDILVDHDLLERFSEYLSENCQGELNELIGVFEYIRLGFRKPEVYGLFHERLVRFSVRFSKTAAELKTFASRKRGEPGKILRNLSGQLCHRINNATCSLMMASEMLSGAEAYAEPFHIHRLLLNAMYDFLDNWKLFCPLTPDHLCFLLEKPSSR